MTATRLDLEGFTVGDFVRRPLAWTVAGTAVNLTGRTFQSQIRYTPGDVTFFPFSIAVDGPNGLTVLTMDDLITQDMPAGLLYWNMKETIAAGEPVAVLEGRIMVRPSITR